MHPTALDARSIDTGPKAPNRCDDRKWRAFASYAQDTQHYELPPMLAFAIVVASRAIPTMSLSNRPGPNKWSCSFRNPSDIRADILMSIKPEHILNISTGAKNHEYRKYLLPASVKRIWFYTSTPVCAFQFVALISPGKPPGQVCEDGGIGNEDFNAGRKLSKFGYEIRKLWKLRPPITLAAATNNRYVKAPPQKYCWAPANLLADYPLHKQQLVLVRRKNKRKPSQITPSEHAPPTSTECVNTDRSVHDHPVQISSAVAAQAVENVTPEGVRKKRRVATTPDVQLSPRPHSDVHIPAPAATGTDQPEASEQVAHSPVTEPDLETKSETESEHRDGKDQE